MRIPNRIPLRFTIAFLLPSTLRPFARKFWPLPSTGSARLVTLLFCSLRRRFRPQSSAVDRYDGVGMLLVRLGRPVHISHLADRRLPRLVLSHLLPQSPPL